MNKMLKILKWQSIMEIYKNGKHMMNVRRGMHITKKPKMLNIISFLNMNKHNEENDAGYAKI